MLIVAVATRRPAPLVWLLATRPVRGLGAISYSLYLVHLPIVTAVSRRLTAPHVTPGVPAFWATVALAVPLALGGATVFAMIFEIPFQRYRSWAALREALRARWAPAHQDQPVAEPDDVTYSAAPR
jgi:peptidoglycan/LPS O-acetylase OafA/YrhL